MVDENERNAGLMQGGKLVFDLLAARHARGNTGCAGLAELTQHSGLCLGIGGICLPQVERDVEAGEVRTNALHAAQQVGHGLTGQQNADHQLFLLIIERLGERVGLVAVFLEQGADLLALRLAHARTVVNDLVNRGFMYARHIGDLFECH